MGKYAVLRVMNTAAEPMTLVVKDPDGNEHVILTLAPGQESTQFTPLNAAWDLRPIGATHKSAASDDVLQLDDSGKGGDKVIGG
jgi:hypothetical protein